MPFKSLRRALLLSACASAVVLAACGGASTVESQFIPTRVVVFGDGMADSGQTGTRYTVNDGTVESVWTERTARRYGLGLTAAAAGGTNYATGNARVSAKPDAAGSSATRTVVEQVDAHLAASGVGANDMVIVNAGISDVIAAVAGINAGTLSSSQAQTAVTQAAKDLGDQVRRLVQAGAKHVAMAGIYNLSRSPWAATTGQVSLLDSLVTTFNTQLLIRVTDLGREVLYVDQALYYNLVTATSPNSSYNMDVTNAAACTSTDAGPGIGITAPAGTAVSRVNSALCTTSTLLGAIDYGRYTFADPVYPTPAAHRLFGDYAYERVRARW